MLDWFKINSMRTDPGKFQFMLLGVKNIVHLTSNVNGKIIPCSNEVKLLGITIDNELKFKKHTEDLCMKASYKLHALRRIRGYLTVEKARILANAFIDSQFNYAPLIWMFADKTIINKLIKSVKFTIAHFGWFTMNITNHTDNFFNSTITCLFIKDSCNIWLWKFLNPLCRIRNPEFMWSYFNENPIPYDLRKGIKIFLPPVKSFRFGLNSIHFRGSILWNNLPSSIKNSLTR